MDSSVTILKRDHGFDIKTEMSYTTHKYRKDIGMTTKTIDYIFVARE